MAWRLSRLPNEQQVPEPGTQQTNHPWLFMSVEWDSKLWFLVSCAYARANKRPRPSKKHEQLPLGLPKVNKPNWRLMLRHTK